MTNKQEAAARLVAVCPNFQQPWQEHQAWWRGEPAGEYKDLGALAQWVVDRMAEDNTNCFLELFREVEALLQAADPEVDNLLSVGFLESIQNVSTNRRVDPDIVLRFLGPKSRKAWFDLIKFWHGSRGRGWPGQKRDD